MILSTIASIVIARAGADIQLYFTTQTTVGTKASFNARVTKDGLPAKGKVVFNVIGQSAVPKLTITLNNGWASGTYDWKELLKAGAYTLQAKYNNTTQTANFVLAPQFVKVVVTNNTGKVGSRVPIKFKITASDGRKIQHPGVIDIYTYGEYRKTVQVPASGTYTEQVVVRQAGIGSVWATYHMTDYHRDGTGYGSIAGTN